MSESVKASRIIESINLVFGDNALQFTSKGLGPYTGILQGAYVAKEKILFDPKSGESFTGYKFNRVMQSTDPKISNPVEQKEHIAREIIDRVSVSLTTRKNEQYLYLGSAGSQLIGCDGELKGNFMLATGKLPENVSPEIITDNEISFSMIRLNTRTNSLKLPRGAQDNIHFVKLDL